MQRVHITEYRQSGAERFARNVRIPAREFAHESETYPGLAESIFWIACFALVLLLCSLAMGADVFKILRMVA